MRQVVRACTAFASRSVLTSLCLAVTHPHTSGPERFWPRCCILLLQQGPLTQALDAQLSAFEAKCAHLQDRASNLRQNVYVSACVCEHACPTCVCVDPGPGRQVACHARLPSRVRVCVCDVHLK
jgi:hypothetical protein